LLYVTKKYSDRSSKWIQRGKNKLQQRFMISLKVFKGP